jgi:hypothetical protein
MKSADLRAKALLPFTEGTIFDIYGGAKGLLPKGEVVR